MKKAIIILSILFFVVLPSAVFAIELRSQDVFYLKPEDTIDGTLYLRANRIIIEGTIKGDLFCAAKEVRIIGRVEGDIYCTALQLDFSGTVTQDARLAAFNLTAEGQINRNFTLIAQKLKILSSAHLQGEGFIVAGQGKIEGSVQGSLLAKAFDLKLNGSFNQTVNVYLSPALKALAQGESVSRLIVGPEAKFKQDLFYHSPQEAEVNPKAQVGGILKRQPFKVAKDNLSIFNNYVFSVLTMLLVGVALVSLWEKQLRQVSEKMIASYFKALVWGTSLLAGIPLLAIFLFITIIGWQLALILILGWVTALLIAPVITLFLWGRSILESLYPAKLDSGVWVMSVGVSVGWLLFSLPILGVFFQVLAVIWGLGGIVFAFKFKNKF